MSTQTGGTTVGTATGDKSLPGAALQALRYFVARDEARAAMDVSEARYSALTVDLCDALRGWHHDGIPTEDDPVMRRVIEAGR